MATVVSFGHPGKREVQKLGAHTLTVYFDLSPAAKHAHRFG